MRPSILVVGPDRVGKTTIVRHLSRMLGIPSFKCPAEKAIFRDGGRSSLAFDYTLTHFLTQTGYSFISDRAYPCEWVYSKVFGRETDVPLLERIDRMHANLGTRILYLFSSEEPREEDDLVPQERYWDVEGQYRSFCEWTDCKVIAYDTASMLRAFEADGDISEAAAEDCIRLLRVERLREILPGLIAEIKLP